MTDSEKKSSGRADDSTSGETANETKTTNSSATSGSETEEDKVLYSSYKKVLGEKKKVESFLNELKAENEALKNAQMQAEGKKDEVITNLQKKIKEAEETLKKQNASYAMRVVSTQVERAAKDFGCKAVKDLIQLSDVSELEINDNYEIDEKSLKSFVEKAKKERPYLFENKTVNVKDANPSVVTDAVDSKTRLQKLSPQEKAMLVASLGRNPMAESKIKELGLNN